MGERHGGTERSSKVSDVTAPVIVYQGLFLSLIFA